MSFLLKNAFHTDLAQNFVDEIQLGKNSYYYFLGKIVPWSVGDVPPSSQTESVKSETDIRNEIITMRKLSPSDVSMVIPRYDWVSGSSYDMWDSTKVMIGKQFYVLTDEYHVYKCIDNNLNGPSTVKPTGTPVSIFKTNDGYQWKYMYTIPLSKRNRFLSSTKMPVQRAISDFFYNNGAITSTQVTSKGTGYTTTLATTINVVGGSPSTPASFIPLLNSTTGSLEGVKIVDPGFGYTSAPTLTLVSSTGAGSGLYGPTAVMIAVVQGGSVVRVMISDPGQNYPTNISTIIDVDGDGVGASFAPIISASGELVDVVINNPGSGYTYANLTVIGAGSGATVIPNIPSADLDSDQSLVESTVIPGGIHKAVITESGTWYTNATITVRGDGTGASMIPVITNGLITDIVVASPGTGYTWGEIVISGNNKINNPGATDAVAYAIMSPDGGHGKNAPLELYANTACLYSQIRYSASTSIPYTQDFRQYGLIRNPRDLYTGTIINNQIGTTTYQVSLSGYFGLVKDMVLVSGYAKYRVVDILPTTALIVPINTNSMAVNMVLSPENDPSTTYSVVQIFNSPDVNKYSGEMIYTCDDYSFAFSNNEAITIKTYLNL